MIQTLNGALAGFGLIISVISLLWIVTDRQMRHGQNPVATLTAIVKLAGCLLPARYQARYIEEWRSELVDLRGWRRVLHAVDLVRGSCRLALQLRLRRTSPRRGPHQHVVPLGDTAQEHGWLSAAFLVESTEDGRVRYRLMCAVRQHDGVRIVALSRYSRRDSPKEITALMKQAAALGVISKRAYRKSRRSKQVEW